MVWAMARVKTTHRYAANGKAMRGEPLHNLRELACVLEHKRCERGQVKCTTR